MEIDHVVATLASLMIILACFGSLLTQNNWTFIFGWDDGVNFVENPMFRSRPPEECSFWKVAQEAMLLPPILNVYEPVAWIWKGFGFVLNDCELNAMMIRRGTLVVHVLTSCLVLPMLVRKLIGVVRGAATTRSAIISSHVAATLFAIHPTTVEVIGWPSAQSYSLAGFFVGISLICILKERLYFGVGAYVLACLSKASALTIVPGLYILWFGFDGWRKQNVKVFYNAVLLLSTAVLLVAVILGANREGMAIDADTFHLTWSQRCLKIPWMLWHLVFNQILYPVNVRAHYQLQPDDLTWWNPQVFYPIGLSLVFLSIARGKVLLIGLCFVCTVAPHFFPHGMEILSADRYCYLVTGFVGAPSVGFFLANGTKNNDKVPLWFGASLLVLILAMMSRQQVDCWRTEGQFYECAIQVDPADWRMLDIYGDYLFSHGHDEQAQLLRERVLMFAPKVEVGPKAALLHAKLAVQLGDGSKACDLYEKLLKTHQEEVPLVLNNVAVCKMRSRKNLQEAIKLLETALRSPNFASLDSRKKIQDNLTILKRSESESSSSVVQLSLMF